MHFSANLGFLYLNLPLPDRIRAAAADGFDAVECHFPYDTPAQDLRDALTETDLPMLSLNTAPGTRAGDFGLAALPDRQPEARKAIAQAIAYAAEIGTRQVHVMAGRSDGSAEAEETFRANLAHACDLAAAQGIGILIEPINTRDVPGYHLHSLDHAAQIIDTLDRPNLKLMFDCYHVQILHGDLVQSFKRLQSIIGHVQIAAVPDRGEPDAGEICYPWLLQAVTEAGYTGAVGAEYRPRSGNTREGLGWLTAFRAL